MKEKFILCLLLLCFVGCTNNQQSKAENKRESVQIPEIFADTNSVLGLRFGMRMENAIKQLRTIGLTEYEKIDETRIMYIHDTAWDDVMYNFVILNYCVSNRQNAYLDEIGLLKLFDDLADADKCMQNVLHQLKTKYGQDSAKMKVGDNGIAEYTIYEKIIYGRTPAETATMSRVVLSINPVGDGKFVFMYKIMGWLEAQTSAQKDNNQ